MREGEREGEREGGRKEGRKGAFVESRLAKRRHSIIVSHG